MKKLFLVCFLIVCSPAFKGQDRKLDSLLNFLSKKNTKDSNKVSAYSELSGYYSKSDIERSIAYADTLVRFSAKIKHRDGMVTGHLFSANAYIDKGDFKKAMNDLVEGEKLFDSTMVPLERLGGLFNSMGRVYMGLRNSEKAEYYYRKSLNIAIRTKNLKRIASGYTNLGSIHSERKQYDSSAYYARLAFALKLKIGDPAGIASACANFALLFLKMDKADSCLYYQDKALKMYEQMGDKVHVRQITMNKGIVLMQNKAKYDEALPLFEKSLAMAKELGSAQALLESYACISDAYKFKGDYRKAYESYVASAAAGDSIFSADSKKIVSEMEEKYQSEKKEKEIELLNKNKEVQDTQIAKQRVLNASIIGGLILITIFSLILFSRLKVTRAQKSLIEQQKKEVELKSEIIEHKQKEILDSIRYAKRIQNALMPSEKNLEKNIKKLQNTKP
jgi:tetratricopeptide (TPR) repeat protein